MTLLRRISLFVRIVFREWEPKSCGIPDPYRVDVRLWPRLAWGVAGIIHPWRGDSQRPEGERRV